MNQITLTVGDYSADGHGKLDTTIIECNLTAAQLRKLDHPLLKEFDKECGDYEVDLLTPGFVANLEQAGVEIPAKQDLETKDFVLLYLRIVQKIFTPFEWSIVEPPETLHIGGYGLFLD